MIGEPPRNRVVLIQYPSMAAAKKWFDEHGAPELKKAEEKKLGTFRVKKLPLPCQCPCAVLD